MDQEIPDNEVLIETRDGVGLITLNRPKVLNALSLDMIRQVATALNNWKDDDAVKAVVFMGAGDRAFCAGGDIKAFYSAGMDSRRGAVGPRVPLVFFGEEYSLNKQIFNYPKPTVSLMNGITMGGGYGVAGHCNVRICGDKTVMAMPEVIIGFFPDIGGLYHLEKCPHHYGRYLAMTGDQVDGRLAVKLGLGDIYADDCNAEKVITAVKAAIDAADFNASMADALSGSAADVDVPHADMIEKVFANMDVVSVFEALEKDGSDAANDALAKMRAVSPTSLKVVAAYLERIQNADFNDVIAQDFVLVQHFIKQPDMYEGIRAKLIDKDNNPKWLPDDIENVNDDSVKEYFTPTGYDLSDVQIF